MDQAASPDPSQHNYTSSEYQGDQQVQEYDSTQDAQQWYDSQVNEDAQQKAERLNRLRLQLERAAAREGTSTGAILERLEEYAPARAVWTEYFDEENTPFFVNEATGETRWQLPRPEELGLELALDALLCDDPKRDLGVPYGAFIRCDSYHVVGGFFFEFEVRAGKRSEPKGLRV